MTKAVQRDRLIEQIAIKNKAFMEASLNYNEGKIKNDELLHAHSERSVAEALLDAHDRRLQTEYHENNRAKRLATLEEVARNLPAKNKRFEDALVEVLAKISELGNSYAKFDLAKKGLYNSCAALPDQTYSKLSLAVYNLDAADTTFSAAMANANLSNLLKNSYFTEDLRFAGDADAVLQSAKERGARDLRVIEIEIAKERARE